MAAFHNEYIKKPNETVEYEPWMLQEVQKCMEDPVYFIKTYVKIQHPTKGAILFEMYDYQIEAVRAMHENTYCMLLFPRQTR